MRAMVMTEAPDGISRRALSLQQRARPEPEGSFDVVVRVAAAGVCRSDLHILMGKLPTSVPHVLGHENSGLGHLAVQILRALCPARILAVDTRAEARDLALACGAHSVCAPSEISDAAGAQADAVVDFVGSDESASSALASLGFGGSYIAVGVGGTLSIPILELVANETRIEGVYVGTYPELVELTQLALRGDVRPVVVPYALSDADQALRDLAEGSIVGRAVLVP